MPGIFNAIGHEWEPDAAAAAAALMGTVASVFDALRLYEEGNVTEAQSKLNSIEPQLREVEKAFASISPTPRMLALEPGHPRGPELSMRYERLRSLGYATPINSTALARIGAEQAGILAHVVRSVRLVGRPAEDWFAIRDIVAALTRALEIGGLTSRISILTSDLPK